jgi:hypothetical protein
MNITMHFFNVTLAFALFALVTGVHAAPTPLPKRVFRPERIGMGYKDRVTPLAQEFVPFPGKFFGGLELDSTNTPRPDRPDKVDRVDSVDSVDEVDSV